MADPGNGGPREWRTRTIIISTGATCGGASNGNAEGIHWVRMRMGCPSPRARGSVVSSHSGVRSGTPAANAFCWPVFSRENVSGSSNFYYFSQRQKCGQ